jgi:hypothetical protein
MEKRGRKPEDLTGQRFGKLVAIKIAGQRETTGAIRWWCKCDCGQEKIVRAGNLKQGMTKSCGCVNKERIMVKRRIFNEAFYSKSF